MSCMIFFSASICICILVMTKWLDVLRYSCTNSKSRDSRRELSNSRRELSISLLEFRNSRLYPIYNSQKQTRITYFSVEKTIKKLQFSSSAFLVYTRITFLLTREIYLKQFSKKCRTRFECRKRIECRTRLECPPGRTAGHHFWEPCITTFPKI